MNSEELVLKYFNSWQEPADFREMESCLSEDLVIESGFFAFRNRNDFVSFLRHNPAPWKDVKLIASVFDPEHSAIVYEGVNTADHKKMRVAELIKISGGKIIEIQTVISQLN
ncbi:MAG: nuclear transport factor 2 family protein [Cytophagales bacterium]|nr:nuclear transport factor 2 family protein [Cytophagales bacterium]